MAKELLIGLVIGAILNGSFTAAFRKADKTVAQLGKGLDSAMRSQERLGSKIERAQTKQLGLQQRISYALLMGDGNANKLIRRYERMQRVIGKAVEKQNQFTQAIQKAQKAQTGLSAAIEKQEQRRQQREKLKGDIVSSTAMTASVVIPAWKSVKTYMEQEEAATQLKVSMLKADGSFGEYDHIVKKAQSLGQKYPGTPTEFIQLAEELSTQGISDKTINQGGLETAAQLKVVLDMKSGAGEFFGKMLEGHGLVEKDFEKAADITQRARFAFGTKPTDMYQSMSYYSPKVNTLGITGIDNYEKLKALEGIGAQVGLEGSRFGTNFAMMISKLGEGPDALKAAKKGIKAEAGDILKQTGVDFNFFDKKGNFRGLDAMVTEIEKLKIIKAKKGEKAALLVAGKLFGEEAARPALIIAEKGRQGFERNLELMRQQGSLQDRITLKTSTLASALESLGGVWESAVGTIGSAFAEDIKEFAKLATELIENDLTPLLKENKTAVKWFIGIAAGMTMASTAVLALKFAFSGVASFINAALMPIRLFKAGKALSELAKVNGKLSFFNKLGNRIATMASSTKRGLFDLVQSGISASQRLALGFKRNVLNAMRSSVGWFKDTASAFAFHGRKIGTGMVSGFHRLRRLSMTVGRAVGGFLARNAAKAGRALLSFGRIMGGAVVKGLMLAGKAFMWLGRAFLMNPIGLAITAIAVGAYLIYTYWEPIKTFFGNLWDWVGQKFSAAGQWISEKWTGISNWFGSIWDSLGLLFSNGIANIGSFISHFNPLQLFQTVFSTVLNWFGIDLPSRFSGFGQNIIDGLVNGIKNAWELAKNTVSELGSGIKNWFAEKLGIHSPSRVFKGYGHNIVEGLAVGIENKQPLASQATSALGQAVGSSFQTAKRGWVDDLWLGVMQFGTGLRQFFALSDWHDRPLRTPNFNPAASNDGLFADYQPLNREPVAERPAMTVHFNPTINLNGNGGDVMNQVQQGLQMSLHEFEQLLNRVLDQRQRRAY